MLASHKDLALKLAEMEKKYDSQFKVVFDAIRELMTPWPGIFMNASTATADTPLQRTVSPLSRSTYSKEYAFLPHGSKRPFRLASARFRNEPP
jgi:hypothetical protein